MKVTIKEKQNSEKTPVIRFGGFTDTPWMLGENGHAFATNLTTGRQIPLCDLLLQEKKYRIVELILEEV